MSLCNHYFHVMTRNRHRMTTLLRPNSSRKPDSSLQMNSYRLGNFSDKVLQECVSQLPSGAVVLDYGCNSELHWALARLDLCVHLADIQAVAGYQHFNHHLVAPDSGIEELTGKVDLIICSHVIEHSNQPVSLMESLFKMLKPGKGKLYVEAPSDRSALVPSSHCVEDNGFNNFWDDPTHVRPYPPAALYRLGLGFNANIEQCGYMVGDDPRDFTRDGWLKTNFLSGIICSAPERLSNFQYISLKSPTLGNL